jgi:serine protease Do
MSPHDSRRPRLGAFGIVAIVAIIAFAGGLILAGGMNLTPFGFAQQSPTTPARLASTSAGMAPVADLSNGFVSIVDHVRPAVVSITTEREARPQRMPQGQMPPGMEDFFRQFGPQQSQPQEGLGSGFIVSPDGYILTNNHVVADADKLKVKLFDGHEYKARVIGRDPTTDVAVIKIDATGLPTASLGDDSKAQVGQWVLAIGNPLSLDFTVTAGIISAKGRGGNLRNLYTSQYAVVDYIQTDAAINPGNSGGPLVDIGGNVIGINSAIASQTGYYSGYGFAIPITLAKSVMDDIIKYGKVRRAILGVSITDVTPADAQVAGLKDIRGALVGGKSPDGPSPAAEAGIQSGDIIVGIDGQPVDHVAQLQRIIRTHQPGQTVDVSVMRYGKQMDFKVKLTQAPNDQQMASSDSAAGPANNAPSYDKLGITVQPLSQDEATRVGLPAAQHGLAVTDVKAGSVAYRQLQPDADVITKILYPRPERAVTSSTDLNDALSKLKTGDAISLLVYNPQLKGTRVVNLQIGD